MKNIFKIIVLFILCINFIYAQQNEEIKTVSPENIKRNNVLDNLGDEELLNNPKVKALMNSSFKKGYKVGVEDTEILINKKLDNMEKYMDSIFAFHRLYLEGKFEPPKIGIVKTPYQILENGKSMVIEQEQFMVIEEGKFVDNPKSWKSFLR